VRIIIANTHSESIERIDNALNQAVKERLREDFFE